MVAAAPVLLRPAPAQQTTAAPLRAGLLTNGFVAYRRAGGRQASEVLMRRRVLNRLGYAFVLVTAVAACAGMLTAAQAAPSAPVAQAAPTPTPAFRPPGGAAPTPAPTARPAATATTSTAPRAGGFPLEL